MKYYLMHKDVRTAIIDFNTAGHINEIIKVLEEEHLPISCRKTPMRLSSWWDGRAVPKDQSHTLRVLQEHGIETTQKYLLSNLGLSLTDAYWVMPVEWDLSWREVSFYTNPFTSKTIEYINKSQVHNPTSGNDKKISVAMFTPAASLGGELEKRWAMKNGAIILIKGNMAGNTFQQSLNEIFASLFHKMQGFSNYAEYRLIRFKDGKTGCYSRNFTNDHVEFIPAWELFFTGKKDNRISNIERYLQACEEEGFDHESMKAFLDYQFASDFIMSNKDRHLNNFGILRNSDTLEAIAPAPIFDTGNSMLYSDAANMTPLSLMELTTHSIYPTERKIAEHISFSSIRWDNLPTDEMIRKLYGQDPGISGYILERISAAFEFKKNFARMLASGASYNEIKNAVKGFFLNNTGKLKEAGSMNECWSTVRLLHTNNLI